MAAGDEPRVTPVAASDGRLSDPVQLNRDAWNAIGPRVASPYLASRTYAAMFSRFCEALPRSARVLDLGCGPGIPLTRELVSRGFRVTGVDFSEAMLKAARQNVPEADFLCRSMTDITYAETFDGVFCSYALLCLDPAGFAATATRISEALVPGGLCFVALNEGEAGARGDDALVTLMDRRMYSRCYSEAEIQTMFSSAGMRVRDIDRDVICSAAYGREQSLVAILQKDPA